MLPARFSEWSRVTSQSQIPTFRPKLVHAVLCYGMCSYMQGKVSGPEKKQKKMCEGGQTLGRCKFAHATSTAHLCTIFHTFMCKGLRGPPMSEGTLKNPSINPPARLARQVCQNCGALKGKAVCRALCMRSPSRIVRSPLHGMWLSVWHQPIL